MTTKAKPGDIVKIIGGDQFVTDSGDIGKLAKFVKYRKSAYFEDYTISVDVIDSENEWALREKDYEVVINKLPDTPPSFKKGDRVLVLSQGSAPSYTVGKAGVVTGPSLSGSAFNVRLDGETESWYFESSRLKLESTNTPTEPTGDLDPRVLAYMHAKTLEPDALIDDRIQLAEWLMNK